MNKKEQTPKKARIAPRPLQGALLQTLIPIEPRKGDLRRHRILEGFIDLVGKDGVEKSTLDALAQRLEMRRTHVTYYFATRNELILAAIQYVTAMMQHHVIESVTSATDWKSQIEGWILGHFKWIQSYPSHPPMMLLAMHCCSVDSELKKLNTQVRDAGVARVSAILRNHFSKKDLSDKDMHRLAFDLQALVAGHLMSLSTTEHSHDPVKHGHTVAKIARMLVETAPARK